MGKKKYEEEERKKNLTAKIEIQVMQQLIALQVVMEANRMTITHTLSKTLPIARILGTNPNMQMVEQQEQQ